MRPRPERTTTNYFQVRGLLKTVSLLGFLYRPELSFSHAKFLLATFLSGIAQVSCSPAAWTKSSGKALILALREVSIEAGSQTAMAPNTFLKIVKCGLIGVCACGTALCSPFSMTGHSEPACYVCWESSPEYHFPEHRVPSPAILGTPARLVVKRE